MARETAALFLFFLGYLWGTYVIKSGKFTFSVPCLGCSMIWCRKRTTSLDRQKDIWLGGSISRQESINQLATLPSQRVIRWQPEIYSMFFNDQRVRSCNWQVISTKKNHLYLSLTLSFRLSDRLALGSTSQLPPTNQLYTTSHPNRTQDDGR